MSKNIGVLALQGDFKEHIDSITACRHNAFEIRSLADLDKPIDGLVLPGGESAVIGMLADELGLIRPLRTLVDEGIPTLGTCAGLILLANKIHSQKQGGQKNIGGLDVIVDRNFRGSQINSFETGINITKLSDKPVKAMFIRPPRILKVGGDTEAIATYDFGKGEEPVMVQQRNIIGASFHTELGANYALHKYFLSLS